MTTLNLSRGGTINVADEDMVLCVYQPTNDGDMPRYGKHDFGGNNYIFYGNRSSGHKFLVHALDIAADEKLAAARGHAPEFIPVTQAVTAIKKQAEDRPTPPPPPEPMKEEVIETKELSDPLMQIKVVDLDIGKVPPGFAGSLEDSGIITVRDAKEYDEDYKSLGGLSNIHGIGSATRERILSAISALEAAEEEE